MNVFRGHPNHAKLPYTYFMPTPEGKFRQKRHPLCPECKYDLIATVDSGRKVCPECGYEFEMYELRGEKRPGDWSFQIGLRNTIISLVIRSLIILPLWAAIIWIMSTYLANFGRFNLIILPFLGMAMGYGFSTKLTDHAGFTGTILMFIAWAFAIAMLIAGVTIVDQFHPLTPYQKFFFSVWGGLPSVLWILKVMVLDD